MVGQTDGSEESEMENLFIGGEYVASSATTAIPVENPATEEVIAEVPDASAADIDRAR